MYQAKSSIASNAVTIKQEKPDDTPADANNGATASAPAPLMTVTDVYNTPVNRAGKCSSSSECPTKPRKKILAEAEKRRTLAWKVRESEEKTRKELQNLIERRRKLIERRLKTKMRLDEEDRQAWKKRQLRRNETVETMRQMRLRRFGETGGDATNSAGDNAVNAAGDSVANAGASASKAATAAKRPAEDNDDNDKEVKKTKTDDANDKQVEKPKDTKKDDEVEVIEVKKEPADVITLD